MNPEMAVIGCIVLDSHEGEIFAEMLPEDFYDIELRELYLSLKQHYDKYGIVDSVSISALPEKAKRTAVLCAETVPALSNWKRYITLAKATSAKYRAEEIARQIADGGMELEEIQQKANELIKAASGAAEANCLDMRQGLLNFMHQKNKPREYIKTGFRILDGFTFIDRGDYIVIGARPSTGKTAFSVELAYKMAGLGHKVVFFSLETSTQKIADRLITSYCGLDFNNVKRHTLGEEWEKIEVSSNNIAKLPIEVIHAPGRTVAWMQAEAVRRKADIVFIDYLGLIKAEGNSRYEKTTNISLDIHNFAQQTGIVVFALSQLNRGGAGRPPTMEDLRESGQIEQDADVIMLLHKDGNSFSVIIAKNKEGEVGDIDMYFDGQHQKFNEVVYR